MSLSKRPRFVYDDGAAVDYTMSLPARPWTIVERGEGGSDVSGAGVPASFEVRRDYLTKLTLRFPEGEIDDVTRLVRHFQRSGTATYYPDVDVGGTSHAVYGDSPKMGEPIEPRRSDEPGTLELDVVVRRTTASAFTDPYF